jgi:hypothetical protein
LSKKLICLILFAAFAWPVARVVGQDPAHVRNTSKMVEGRDYLVVERVRLLDTMGFDRPVEAISFLVPRGWRTEGGVVWKGIGGCRAEIVQWQMSATSPDGAIRFLVLPQRSFVAFQDQMMRQSAMRRLPTPKFQEPVPVRLPHHVRMRR